MKRLLPILLILPLPILAQIMPKVRVDFASNSDPVYAFLRKLQRTAYDIDTNAYRWKNTVKELALLDSISCVYHIQRDSMNKYYSRITLPTDFEDPISYCILHEDIRQIESQLDKDHIDFARPHYGTLPMVTLDAQTSTSYKGVPLLVMNSGVFGFCHEMTKIGMSTGDFSYNQEKVTLSYDSQALNSILQNDLKAADKKRTVLMRFSMALEDYVKNRRIKGVPLNDTMQAELIQKLVNCMELFTLGHEFGHIVLKHIATEQQNFGVRHLTNTSNGGVPLDLHTWQQEIDADMFGWLLLNNYIKTNPSIFDGLLYQSPYLFFTLAQISEECNAIYVNKSLPVLPNLFNRDKYEAVVNNMAIDGFNLINRKWFAGHYNFQMTKSKVDTVRLSLSGDHPPYWLRAKVIQELVRQNPLSANNVFYVLGPALAANFNTLWSIIKKPWLDIASGKEPEDIALNPMSRMKRQLVDEIAGSDTAAANSLLSFLEKQRRKDEPAVCDSLIRKAEINEAEGDAKKIIAAWTEAEACGVTSSSLYFSLGKNYVTTGDYVRAVYYTTKAIDKDENKGRASYYWNYGNRAISETFLGNYQKAELDFKKAFKNSSRADAHLLYERANLYFRSNRFAKALVDYQKAHELAPYNVAYAADLCEAYVAAGRYKTVILNRQKFSDMHPSDADFMIYDFYEFVSKLQLGKGTKELEERLNKWCSVRYDYIWYFATFNRSMVINRFSRAHIKKVLYWENKIKNCLTKTD